MESAVDAALSAKAKGPLEKMLVHQLAALHRVAMKQLATTLNDNLTVPDMAKASNAAARSMQVFQEGLITLERLHSGGKQTVVVKHLTVADGGQALVAGNVNGTQRVSTPAPAPTPVQDETDAETDTGLEGGI